MREDQGKARAGRKKKRKKTEGEKEAKKGCQEGRKKRKERSDKTSSVCQEDVGSLGKEEMNT